MDLLHFNFKSVKINLQRKNRFLYITNLFEHADVVKFTKYSFNWLYQGILLIYRYTFNFTCHTVGNVSDFIFNMATINSEISNVILKVALILFQNR